MFMIPDADYYYFGDFRFWRWYKDRITDDYQGRIITSAGAAGRVFNDGRVLRMNKAYDTPLSTDPTALAGLDSGYQAINLAAHLLGPGGRIVLVSYDMGFADGVSHSHAPHPEPSREESYVDVFRPKYVDLMTALMLAGIELVRLTPSNLDFVPLVSPEGAY
jgi:hypothetical protein